LERAIRACKAIQAILILARPVRNHFRQVVFNRELTELQPQPPPLRILILSTPKTGNTWLARLLSAIYELPQLGLTVPFDRDQARSLGARWVVFHHVRPSPEILDWIDQTQPFLVSVTRHPADVLVSLYYHVRGFQPGPLDANAVQAMLAGPYERTDIASDAGGSFQDDLECSLSWMRTGRAHIVRYEDLWRDTRRELIRLTSLIYPVPERSIELAIERGDFSLMRRLAGKHGRFFRSGKVGNWLEALPEEVCAELSKDPYRRIIGELGYSMDPTDPIISAPQVPRVSVNPFQKSGGDILGDSSDEARFDNGVPVVALLVDLYLALCRKHKWAGAPSATGEGSFYHWLNQPCEVTGQDGYARILITNLALELHQLRPDLNQSFRDLRGPARADYADWFVRGGARRVELDPCFIEPMRRHLVAWAGGRSPEDHEAWAWWPKLPNFAMHLYHTSADLRTEFPDVLCFDRWSFLEWIIRHQQEANINPEFVGPVSDSLKRLARLRSVGRYVPGARVRIAKAGGPT
jgi:hypothetical protein